MCGILGAWSLSKKNISGPAIEKMYKKLFHRGPDQQNIYVKNEYAAGFCRLSIMDLNNGMQPFMTDDESIILLCNGEIFNYKELRRNLEQEGFRFKTNCDVEVILHLYRKEGIKLLHRLNGQFAFSVFDRNLNKLFLAKDHFGICPLFYTQIDDEIIYASEIKSILEYPGFTKSVDIKGLDQIFNFPGNISPTTMFKNVNSILPGHYLEFSANNITDHEYWDLDYPLENQDNNDISEKQIIDELDSLLATSVRLRLNADVPLGFYLSGGLDSSLLCGIKKEIDPAITNTFSIFFSETHNSYINERPFQKIMVDYLKSHHTEEIFNWDNIYEDLCTAVYYSESPLKEMYNVCTLNLSKLVNQNNIKVILSGEGSDELFGGYYGYKFDMNKKNSPDTEKSLDELLEDEYRKKLWGVSDLNYEKNYYYYRTEKKSIYSHEVNTHFSKYDSLNDLRINKSKIIGRSKFNQRSYIDFKLRLGGHLIADHGDRMAYANSVEVRYPFLDVNLIDYVKKIPAHYKLKGSEEKYILKQLSNKYIPSSIINREKFGFVAPGSPELLKKNNEWVNDLLSYDLIKKQGYFNPDTIEYMKKMYSSNNFSLNIPYEDDLLMIVLTFNIFLNQFNLN